jgi:hypothetical protein
MVGKRRDREVRPRTWSGDVDEDEVRAVAALVVEAYDAARSDLSTLGELGVHGDRLEPIRAAVLDACGEFLDVTAPATVRDSSQLAIRNLAAGISHLRSVLFKEPFLRSQARQLAAGSPFGTMPSPYGLGDS